MIWRDIPSLPGYQASDDGQIRSVDRVDSLGRQKTGQVLGQQISANGYAVVSIYFADRKRGLPVLVHRLVCEAFHGPAPFLSACALHWRNDLSDNTPANVRWGSQAENMHDKMIDGTQTRGESHGPSRLTDDAVREIRKSAATSKELARQFDVHPETIRQVRIGRTWQHVE
jgi:hypothetical protein